MRMSNFQGTTISRRSPGDAESVATIEAALDAGINFLDTGDFYGMGRNELLISRAIKERRDDAFLSVKFGAQKSPSGAFLGADLRPNSVKTSPPILCSGSMSMSSISTSQGALIPRYPWKTQSARSPISSGRARCVTWACPR